MFLKNIVPIVVPLKLGKNLLYDGKHYCALGVLSKQLLNLKDYELFKKDELSDYYQILKKLNEDFDDYNNQDNNNPDEYVEKFSIEKVISMINRIVVDNDNADRYSRRRNAFIKNLITYKIPFVLEENINKS